MGSARKFEIDGGHVLVIRIWLEPDGFDTQRQTWRGQISCSDRRRHFAGLGMLYSEIAKMLDELSGRKRALGEPADDED